MVMWLEIIFRTLLDWILELPPDLLGRKVERILDGYAEKRRRPARRRGKRSRNSSSQSRRTRRKG